MQFENTAVISTAKSGSHEKKNKPTTFLLHSTEVFEMLTWLWLLFPSQLLSVQGLAQHLLGSRASRAE